VGQPGHAQPELGRAEDRGVAVAPERERRVLVVLGLASFLAVINFAASAPFFPQIARDLDTTVPLLGQVPPTVTLVAALLGLAIGPLADRYGYRRLMVVGVVAVAVNLLGTGMAPSYAVLLALAVAGGLGDAILFGLPLALAGSLFDGDARRQAIAWVSAALPAGSVLGVPLLTMAGEVVSWRVVFLGTGLATLASAPLAVAWLPRERGTGNREQKLARRSPTVPRSLFPVPYLAAYRPLLRHRPLLALYAAGGLRMAGWTGLTMYLGAFLANEFGFGPGRVGAVYLLSGALVLCGSLLAGRLRRVPLRPLTAWTLAVHATLLGLVFVVPLGAVATIALLAAASFIAAFSYVGLMTLTVAAARELPGGLATAMVLTGSVLNLGVTLGGALGGLLLALGGWPAVGLGLPLFALAAVGVLARDAGRG
jgi:predicted MFS family arabinose efflux permease